MRQPIRPRSLPPVASTTPTFVQSKTADTGTGATTNQSLSLTTAATAGNLLVACGSSDATLSTPTGFTLAASAVNAQGCYMWYKVAVGGETNISTQPGVSDTVAFAVLEYSGIVTSSPLDVTVTDTSIGGTTGPITAGTTSSTAQAVELIVACAGPHSFGGGGLRPTGSTWTNSYVSRIEITTDNATNSINAGLFVADLVTSSAGTQTTSVSWTNSAQDWGAITAAFKGT